MLGALKATRRRFFGLAGVVPIAAKAAVDAEIGQLVGGINPHGLGNASLSLSSGGIPDVGGVPYAKRLIAAADYLKLQTEVMGCLPHDIELRLRDDARYIGNLDPDIACKKSWSMAFKITAQRQRNYERGLRRIMESGRQQRAKDRLKAVLGFEWPW